MSTTGISQAQPAGTLTALQRVLLEDMPAPGNDVLNSATGQLVPGAAHVRVPVAVVSSAI